MRNYYLEPIRSKKCEHNGSHNMCQFQRDQTHRYFFPNVISRDMRKWIYCWKKMCVNLTLHQIMLKLIHVVARMCTLCAKHHVSRWSDRFWIFKKFSTIKKSKKEVVFWSPHIQLEKIRNRLYVKSCEDQYEKQFTCWSRN